MILDALAIITRDSYSHDIDGDCPICKDPIAFGVVTRCGHIFDRQCLEKYVRDCSATECPICRHTLGDIPGPLVLIYAASLDDEFSYQHGYDIKSKNATEQGETVMATHGIECGPCNTVAYNIAYGGMVPPSVYMVGDAPRTEADAIEGARLANLRVHDLGMISLLESAY